MASRSKKQQNMVAVVVIVLVIAMVLGMAFLIGGTNNLTNTGNNALPQTSGTQEEQFYSSQLAVNPNDYNSLVGMGNVSYDRNDYNKAIAYYERALSVKSDDPGLLVDTGTAYFYREPSDPDTALLYYDRALKLNPNFQNALFNQAIVTYGGKGDPIKARALFVSFIQRFPNSPQAAGAKEMIAKIDQDLGGSVVPGK